MEITSNKATAHSSSITSNPILFKSHLGSTNNPASAFIIILAIIGIIGNLHAMYIYIQRYIIQRRNQPGKNIYLVFVISLACLDLFNCLVIPPMDNVYMSRNFTPLSENACKVVRWIQYASHASGILHIVLISIHCMRQMCYRGGWQIQEKHAKILCTSFHMLALIVSLPMIFLAGHKTEIVDGEVGQLCVVGHNNVDPNFLIISLGFLSTAFVICLMIILSCYVALILNMWRNRKRHESHSNPKTVEKVYRRITTILIILTVIFVISYLPYMILAVLRVANQNLKENSINVETAAYKLFIRFQLVNNVANPIVYGFLDKEFREKLSQMYKCIGKCQKSNLSPRAVEL